MAGFLDERAIDEALRNVPRWRREDRVIARTFKCKDFGAAITFVNHVALLAEQENHHPDIEVSWNSVTLRLTTHSAGGLTVSDFDLAALVDKLSDDIS
jgi:4a-hydroxytetrahydrobiopterin dehydratase